MKNFKSILFGLIILLLTTSPVLASVNQPDDPPVLLPAPQVPALVEQVNSPQFYELDSLTTHHVFLPLLVKTAGIEPVGSPTRQTVVDLYTGVYLASNGVPINWTGSYPNCLPGTTSLAFRDSVFSRINYFREMAGVPSISQFNPTYNQKAQAAALLMGVNNALDHTPPTTWSCYSAEAAQGAGSSNLALGVYGPEAISLYMKDPGNGNEAAGHRRWILYPQTQSMGTGDVPGASGYSKSNALVVFDENTWGPRPATRFDFVAWPPPGYVPYQVVFPRWSFSYPGADFSGASVTMKQGQTTLNITTYPVSNGYGENTLVWIPESMTSWASWPSPAQDTLYSITIRNVRIDNQYRDFAYDVIIIDPSQ